MGQMLVAAISCHQLALGYLLLQLEEEGRLAPMPAAHEHIGHERDAESRRAKFRRIDDAVGLKDHIRLALGLLAEFAEDPRHAPRALQPDEGFLMQARKGQGRIRQYLLAAIFLRKWMIHWHCQQGPLP